MVPLRVLVGKMIRRSYVDLMTLTDTLPSMSDIERKRQILNFATFARKQFLKLSNIMAHLANQNKIFQDTSDYLHKIHIELPAARTRNYDVKTAIDVLTTGTYQRMPTKIKDMVPPPRLTDEEVLDTFHKMNDLIRVRLLTTELIPSPMTECRIGKSAASKVTYMIENGRIYFSIENEFNVSLTLMGPSNDRRWWIVSLDVLVQASEGGGGAADVDISFNESQQQHLRVNAQKQLTPPRPNQETTTENTEKPPFFFPLVNLYDYLHIFCLEMQLEIVHMQAAMLARTRWLNQLKVNMDASRSKLTLSYWGGGSIAAQWACPQPLTATVRDEFKGLIQKAGIGASVALADTEATDRHKVVSALKYPKTQLDLLWGGSADLHTKDILFNPTDLSTERLLHYITGYHSQCIIEKLRQVLQYQENFLEENGLHLTKKTVETPKEKSTLVIRYRHQRYISIDIDTRTGHIRVCETGHGYGEWDVKLKELEEKINNDPINTARHLLWLRSDIVVREIVSLAKQLKLQPYYPPQMNLRADDVAKLFSDIPAVKQIYPTHCIFLQFLQFEDWYFVVAIVNDEFQAWLCCLS
ncbi:mediator complex subunit MED14-domain-containing protein [Spinellus fusiger]|nr:mediator complex subunit MED14-domain-containing protein [Spinellus fusiger]